MGRRTLWASLAIVLGFAIAHVARSQSSRPAFEVASIKENTAGGTPIWTPRRSGNRVILRRVRVDDVIDFAWHLDHLYEVSFPANMPLEWYDIEVETEGVPGDDHLRLMYQTLLEDRFKVKTHRETREIPQYDLTVSKAGKLKPADPKSVIRIDGIEFGRIGAGVSLWRDGAHFIGKGASMEQIVESIGNSMRAPVRDMTGLSGTFDFNVLVARNGDSPDIATAPPLQEAIQTELGLKLEKSKGPMSVLVVDHVEKPTPN